MFFERHVNIMLAICIRYVKKFEDAEDVMLTGFQKFFDKINTFEFRGNGSEKAFLKKIMVNECLMLLRQQKHFLYQNEMPDNIIDAEATGLDKLAADDIFNYIVQLPAGYRTVFNLYVLENMSHKEIAIELNISEGTSKSQLNKARKALQQMIEKDSIINL